jgi:hypothetical protein
VNAQKARKPVIPAQSSLIERAEPVRMYRAFVVL